MAVSKVIMVLLVCYWVLKSRVAAFGALQETTLVSTVGLAWRTALQLAIAVAATLAVIGAADYGWQRWRLEQSLRMSRQEVKDDTKREEGDPLVKARVRKLQREAATKRMLKDVPKATVVITNPTHLAVALKYERGNMPAPKVVAKGAGFVAAAHCGISSPACGSRPGTKAGRPVTIQDGQSGPGHTHCPLPCGCRNPSVRVSVPRRLNMAQAELGTAEIAQPTRSGSEAVLSLALLGVLVVLLVPLPPIVLDLLLALNLALTILLLLVTLAATKPLDFSVFPTLLLLMTLLRLSLNVATTRQILLNGQAGMIVAAFGNVVVGGNLVVGLVVFLILIIIQFVVITKGAGRIAEVAARFTLDALPGKQMAIDAELNAGAIDEGEARRRRRVLDSRGRVSRGDGRCQQVRPRRRHRRLDHHRHKPGRRHHLGLTRGMDVATALRTYSVLSVGDGLVSQIPALIVATASGILVTKATSQSSVGQEISTQVAANPKRSMTGAIVVGGPGNDAGLAQDSLPAAGVRFVGGRPPARARPNRNRQPATPQTRPSKPSRPSESPMEDFLQMDRACLEIGARLIPLVDPKRGAGFARPHRRFAARSGQAERSLGAADPRSRQYPAGADAYRILIGGREVARGSIRPGSWLAIDPGGARLAAHRRGCPRSGFRPGGQVDCRKRSAAGGVGRLHGRRRHRGRSSRTWVRRCAATRRNCLGREDLKNLVDKVRETSPSLVDELIPNLLTMGGLHRVLVCLLEERVPISNLTRILESLSHHILGHQGSGGVDGAGPCRPGPGHLRPLSRCPRAIARLGAGPAPGNGFSPGPARQATGARSAASGKVLGRAWPTNGARPSRAPTKLPCSATPCCAARCGKRCRARCPIWP